MSDNLLLNESGSFDGFLSEENSNTLSELENWDKDKEAIAPLNEPLEVDDPSLNYNLEETETQLKQAVDQITAETNFILGSHSDNLQSLGTDEVQSETLITDQDTLLGSEAALGEYDSLTGAEETDELEETSLLVTHEHSETSTTSSDSSLEESLEYQSGFFTITDPSGQVTFDHLFDGGGYNHGELAIFSLAGLEPNQLSWAELVKEATRRALSNSEEGYVVLSDSQEGARFSGELGEPDYNRGEYLGVKTFQMRPGDTFGVMLVPNASVAELFDNPELGGYKKPIFSMSLENPHNIEQFSQVVDMNVFQMADVLGDGHTFALEDIRIVNHNSDQDYNDIIFQVRGAKADAIHLDRLLEGGLLKQDWRDLELGQSLVNYAELAVAAANDLLDDPLTPDLSDPVRNAVERAENLDNYDPELLAAQTEWVIWFAPNPYIEVSQIATLLGADLVNATGHIDDTYIWKFPEAISAQEVQQRLADLVGGDFAYPLVPIELKKPQFIPDESLIKDQWHLPDTSEVNGNTSEGANAINAWDWSTGKGVVIAIVDDGVQQDHPDLIERFKYAAENGLNLDLNNIEDSGGDPVFANVETTFATSNRIQFSDGPVESIQDLFGLSNRLRWMNEELSWTELFGMSNRIRWSDEGELSWNELFGLSNRIRWSDEPKQFLEGLFGLSNRIRWADGSEMNLEELFGLSNRLRWAEDAGLLQQDFAGLGENRTLIWDDGEEKGSEVPLEELFGLSNRIRWSDNTEQFLEELFGLSNRIRWSDNTEVTLEQLFGLSNRIRWSEDPQLLLEDLFGLSNRIRWSDEALEANWDDIFNQANSLQNVSDPEEFLTALFGEGDWIQWEDGTAISIDELFGLSNRIRWSSEPELFWDSLFGMSNRIRWSEDPVLFWDTLFGMSNRVRWMEDSQLSWDWTELFGLSNRIRWSEDAGFFLEDLFGLSNRIRWSDDRPVDWSKLVSNIHEILAAEPGDRTELWQQWYGGENALIWSDNNPVSWQELGAVVTDIDWSETLDESWSWKQLFGLSNRIRWSEDAPPPPYHPPGMHGTAVAGVAGAAGTQHGGVSGGAPDADLAAIRLTADKVTDEKIATAISHAYYGIDIYNNSWKPADNFVSAGLSLAALENNALKGRDGLGNVIIFAAGNDGWDGGDVNYNPFANSRYVIPVAAIDYQGQQSWYSEPGASLLVSASSSSAYRDGTSVGITTTDLVGEQGYGDGNYTDRFGGTSSAAPLVSGIVALMLEANPNLTWRDVQHILVETTQKNDPTHSDWVQNGAGLWVNHSYGFGAVDATLATQAAMNWEVVQPEIAITSGAIDIVGLDAEGNIDHTILEHLPPNNPTGIEIPDFDATGITDSVTIYEDIKIEKIEIVFDAQGLYRGDLEIVLIAPDGTESVLAQPRFDDGTGYENWVFTSARHWGESSLGEWQLQVRDLMSGDVGTWNGWKLNFYGTENDAATVSVTATDTDATEDGNAGQLVFTRDGGDISKALMAQYSIAGTATNGSDYQELTGTVIFEPGQTKVTIGVVPFHDYELEGNETVEITLIDGIGYSLGTEISDTVTIENSTIIDRYGSFVYVNPANGHLYLLSAPDTWLGAQNQAEAVGGNLVSINTAEEQQWIVDTFGTSQVFHIGLTDSERYGKQEGDFKWVNGDSITYTNWKEGEPNNTPFLPEGEDFSVINQHVDGKWNDRTYIGNFPGIIEIDPAQLDQPIVNIMVTDSLAGEEGNAGQIVIQRIGNLDQSLSVNYSLGGDATNGSDFQTLSGNIIIPAGETLVTLPIIALADDEIEGNKTVVVNLAEGDYENGTQPSGHIIITDQNPINRIANEAIGRDVSLFDEWMERWQNGETLEQLRPAIIQSAVDGQGNNQAELKIAEFYQELLGREAETTEIAYWRNQLETGATLSQVRQEIEGADFIDTPSYVYTNPVTGNRYFLTTPDTWLGAQEQAQALGGNLVTIDDADENQWLVDTFGSGRMWIGLNDSPIYGNTEGNHQWVSGETSADSNWWNATIENVDNALHTPEGEDFTETNFLGTPGLWNDMPSQQNFLGRGIVEILAPIADRSWIRQLGTVNSDQSRGVVVDSDGNVYIAGATSGSLDGNTNASGINANFSDPFLTKYDAEGNKLWTRQPGSTGFDYYNGIANDSEGNLYTVGYDDGPGHNGTGDITLTKWDSDGNQLWSQFIGTAAHDWASGVTVDSAGHVYIAGYSLAGISDALLAKFDSNGNLIWQQTLGSEGEDMARSVVTDAAGNVYVAGVTTGNLDGNTNAGSTDIFLTKYDASGAKLWTEQLGTPAADGYVYITNVGGEYRRNVQLGIDSEGNIYLSGTTEGDLNGNTNAGRQDAFLVKYDPNGTQLWTEQVGTAGDDRGWGVTVDLNGMVYWTGTTQGSLNGQPHFGSNDTFVTTLDSDGNFITSRIIATANDDFVQDITSDRSGNIYTTGNSTGSVANTNAGNYDAWVSKNTFVNIGPIISEEPTNLIQNGDFEAVDISGFLQTYNDVTLPDGFGWSLSNANIDLINLSWSGVSGTSNPDSIDQSLDIDSDATLSQTFTTEVGQTYELSFWYAHNPDLDNESSTGYIDVTGNNSLLSTTLTHDILATHDNMQFVKYTTTFTADSNSTTLSFQGDAANGATGFVIDDVRVVPVTELNYDDFSSLEGLNLIGSAAQLGDTLRLTPKVSISGAGGQAGAVWHATPQSVEDGFETTFQFQINDLGGSGGDGFAFVIQNSSADAIGGGGGTLGYSGIYNSLAVEFDTFDNNETGTHDPSDNHLSVHTGGTGRNSVAIAPLGATSDIPNMSDGEVHTVKVKYIPGTLQIFMDDLSTPVLTVPVDLGTTLDLENGNAWVGFTAATAGAWENHDILNWTFSNPPAPENNPPTLTTTNLTLTGATENTGFTVTHADLLAATGATDIDGDPLTFRIQTVGSDIPTKNGQPVEAGVTTLSAGEAIVWTPTTVGNAQPAFTATLTDGKVTVATPVTVSIDVNPVTVSIEATDPDATEGSDPGEFTFTRTGDTSNPMTVNFTIEPSIHWSRPQARNGTDYETIPTSIIIPEGETSITLTITSLEDTEAEWPETVRLKVAEGEGYEINSTENLDTVVIWDNETPQLQLMGEWYSGQPTNFHRESYTSESRNDEHFLLRRIGSVEEDLTVYYSLPGTATNGEDYEELPGSIIIPAGQHSVSFTFIPIDDSEVEGDETVEVTLTPDPTYTFMNHQGRIWDRIPVTLVDNDDKPTVEITVSDNQASEYGDPGQFTISRTGDTSNPLTVDYWISTGWWHKAKNGIDYEAIPESITIPAGESSITIDINPIDDSELEEDEIVDIYLKSNPNYAMRGTYYAQLKILDNETQSLQSQQQFGTSAEDVANSIAVDSTGNTYTVGHTSGDLDGTNAGGKDAFIVKRDSSDNELWQIQLGTAGDDEAKQIAVDSADNLYVLGWSGDPSNSWIAKYDNNGTQQWQKTLGIAGYDITHGALTLGNDGSLYVTGRTTGDLNGTNQGATDTWVAKYDSDGIQTWVKQLGTSDEDEALGIAVDNNSNVYITGETKGSLAGTREGDGDAWVAQLDSSGNLQWQTQLGTTAVDIARSVAVDNNGHVYLGGQTFGWLGETYSGSANHWVGDRDAWWKGIHGDRSGLGGTYYGNGDAWVAQLDSATGTINWKRLIGTPEADTATKVVADSLGNVYLTGTTQGKIGETEYGGEDIFLAKYNLNGALQWKKQVGSEGDDIVNDLILDITGLYLTGKTTGNLKGSNLGENDAWVMTFS